MSIRYKGQTVANVGGGGGGSGGIPSGGIIIWSGSADNIPDGWALCDGTNDTPDLRGRFVLGSSESHTVGETGGEETHTLTVAQLPAHKHGFSALYGSGTTPVFAKGTDLNNLLQSSSRTTTSEGSSQPHNNMSPYYTLAYIMKL